MSSAPTAHHSSLAARAALLGSIDDGTGDGGINSIPSIGDMVKLPIPDGSYKSEIYGTGAVNYQSSGIYACGNSDGSGTVLQLQSQDAIAHSGGTRISFPFYGRRFGVRYLSVTGQLSSPGFTVGIDGVKYRIRNKAESVLGLSTPFAEELYWICPDLLKDARHIAEIFLPGSLVSGNTYTMYVTGMIADRHPGNGDPVVPRRAVAIASGQLSAAAVQILSTLVNESLYPMWVSHIEYWNTDKVLPHLVKLQNAGGQGTVMELVLGPSGAPFDHTAGSTGFDNTKSGDGPPPTYTYFVNGMPPSYGVWRPPQPVALCGNDATYGLYLKHFADTANLVNYQVWGGR